MSRTQRLISLLRGWAKVPGLLAALNPDIVHVHSLPTPAATVFLRHIPRMVVSAWGSDVVQRDPRKVRWYPQLLAHAARVTATSQYLARVVQTYLPVPRLIDVVPFGVDTQRFVPAVCMPSTLTIGTLRHLEPNYGIDILLQALPIIETITHQRITLEIGGGGTQTDMLHARAKALDIADQVNWRGRIPHADVPHFLQQLSLFAMPSRAESFGVAALEAQACGLPVVASDVGGLPEVVRQDETGLLVPPENPQALAEAIATLLTDGEQRATMSAAARRWVVERYQWRASVEHMLNVYAQMKDEG
jgi:glycosyltransferase involved in cell wall biosynthesis